MRGRFWDTVTFGSRRRRRSMLRRLRELDRLDGGRPRPGSGRAVPTSLMILAALMLSVVVLALQSTDGLSAFVRESLLGRDVADADSTGRVTYRFLTTQPGRPDLPVTFSSCRPIELVVDARRAPPGGGSVLADAAREVAIATGLDLRIVGHSTQGVDSFRAERRLRHDVAPVLVTWTTPAEVPDLKGRVAGVAGGLPIQQLGTERLLYGSGTVALDAPSLGEVLRRPDGRRQVQAVVMHELAHLVGLTHVDDPEELMYSDNVGRLTFGRGDREGLARLGRGPCVR